ncbi:MAG: hypothetical protein V7K21_20190 [Nostoc sp.]
MLIVERHIYYGYKIGFNGRGVAMENPVNPVCTQRGYQADER